MNIPINEMFCGCGLPARYSVTSGQTACNKYFRCPTYKELVKIAADRYVTLTAVNFKNETLREILIAAGVMVVRVEDVWCSGEDDIALGADLSTLLKRITSALKSTGKPKEESETIMQIDFEGLFTQVPLDDAVEESPLAVEMIVLQLLSVVASAKAAGISGYELVERAFVRSETIDVNEVNSK